MPVGRKTGGRQKGSKNRKTKSLEARVAALQATVSAKEAAQTAQNSNLMPLDYLLMVMRDDSHEMPLRIDAAKSAAPYVHPKLSSMVGPGGEVASQLIEIIRFSDATPKNPPSK